MAIIVLGTKENKMNINKISSNLYGFSLEIPSNPYCSHFEFILHTDDARVPKNKVIFDLFGTGHIFMKLPANKMPESYNSNLVTVLSTYWRDPDSSSQFTLTSRSTEGIPNWVSRYENDDFNGWIFDTSLLFDLQENSNGIGVCKHFTGSTPSGISYQSLEYSFANYPPFSVCSNIKVAVDKTVAHSCAFPTKHAKCPFYDPRNDILDSYTVSSYGSESSILLQLKVFPCLAGDALYTIVNEQTKDISYSINVEQRTEETDSHAKQVFQDIISSYQDGFTAVDNSHNNSIVNSKNSYILSLS